MRWRSVRLIIGGRSGAQCASTLAPAAQAEDFLSALFGAFGASRSPRHRLSYANEGDARAPQSWIVQARGYSGGAQAYCVRTCDGRYFPISCPDGQSRARHATISARPAKPRWFTAAISIMRQPRAENPIRSCRMRFAIAANWSRDARATARIRSVSRRSRSRTMPHFRKGDLVTGADGLMVAGDAADKRGASLNFWPALGRIARARAGGGLRIIQRRLRPVSLHIDHFSAASHRVRSGLLLESGPDTGRR